MFHRLLIANRGEVAVRIARACRSLGIAPIGVISEADRGASWTEVMDEVVCVGPAAPSTSYLRMQRIVQAAHQTRASAVHPGWGFLAENQRFAALVRQHGFAFVGPSTRSMREMGQKSPAKRAMRAAGLDVVPGSDGPLADADAAVRVANEVGYPVLLKAESGGGGRGMRRVDREADVHAAFSAAAAEAASAFGDASVFLEKLIEHGRHIEVQVLCDHFGNGVHLGERECSVQRKHQKLLEESPSPALSRDVATDLGERALAAALAVGYASAGTIEFLLTPGGEFYFLEMNTRLQVEHPVSELVSGVDIAAEQIRIAANHRLSLTQADVRLSGHAIELRINAEDPAEDFRPTPGQIERFDFPSDVTGATLRIDTHVRSGDTIPPYYDSLVAKLLVHAADRAAAIEALERVLDATHIEGIATTIPLHRAVLADPGFRAGNYDTSRLPGWERA
ncbi:MAG: acetyl-CoA carboxylase biotin carboxylase subunit [Planctomycetota bacterium]